MATGSAGVAPGERVAPVLAGPRRALVAHRRVALALALGLVLRAVLLPITAGPDFRIWDLTAAAALHGQDTYSRPPAAIDRYGPYAYFPLYLYLLLPLKWLALHTGLPYVVLGKLPVVAGDAGVALGLGTVLRRAGRGEGACALGVGLFFLNPLVLYNGAFYGRFDSLALAVLLLTWVRLPRVAEGRAGLATPYALAVALKTFPIFLLPYLLARLGLRRGRRVALATVLVPLVISLPYLLHDAQRFLYIVFVYDSTKGPRQFSWQIALLRLGLSERAATVVSYGLLALFALALVVPLLPLTLKGRGRQPLPSPPRSPSLVVRERGARGVRDDPYVYAAVAFTLFLVLSKVVYEQYLLWPLPFLIVLAVRDRARDALALLVVLSVTGLLANGWIHPFGYNPYPALWLNGLIAGAAALFVLGRVVSRQLSAGS